MDWIASWERLTFWSVLLLNLNAASLMATSTTKLFEFRPRGLIGERLVFHTLRRSELLHTLTLEQSGYTKLWPPVPADMLPSGHWCCRAIKEFLVSFLSHTATTSLFPSTHLPSVHHSEHSKAVAIATGRPANVLGDHFFTEFPSVFI